MAIEQHWQRRTALSVALLPLAGLFALLAGLRRRAYRRGWLSSRGLPVPVVVIGNVTVGGTGKTPLVIHLANRLGEAGYRVGIVSRGYGGSRREPTAVSARSDPREVGDEAVLIAAACARASVWIARDRPAAASALLAAAPCDLLLSDDGLQHYALRRDIEVAVIDARRGFGNGWRLPAGPLREPCSRLREVDMVVCNGSGAADSLAAKAQYRFELRIDTAVNLLDGAARSLASLRGTRVHALAGIGDPARFFEALRAHDLRCIEHPFPDHHAFRPSDLAFGDALPVLMTGKDAVKCAGFAQPHYWSVTPALVDDGDAIAAALLRLLGREPPP